jgi:hypothetical protein
VSEREKQKENPGFQHDDQDVRVILAPATHAEIGSRCGAACKMVTAVSTKRCCPKFTSRATMKPSTDRSWWDEVHRTMWRLAGRYDLTELTRSARQIARQVVETLVASGARSDHSWTEEKARLLRVLDDGGLTSIVANLGSASALPLAASLWELAWIDGGAAVCALSGGLAQMVVRDFGTPEQRAGYLSLVVRRHGALCLTEPLPGAGSDATLVDGRIGIAEWKPGEQPVLEVEKRGRFTSHMDFADFAVVAVDSRDARLRGSCLVILEPGDAGIFDRGTPIRKLGHQLSSTTNPTFQLRVPAERVLGGYSIEGDVIVPKYNHRELLAPTFRRTRAVMALVTASKMLSVLAPVVASYRTYDDSECDLGPVVELWATGEAAASLGFSAVRLSDDLDRFGAGLRSLDRQTAVICPAAKLFSTTRASEMLRIAASIVGKGRTLEAGSGFVGHKLIDAQLESVYLGPEAMQRREIAVFMTDPAFLAEFEVWTLEMRQTEGLPGAITLAAAMELWSWTLNHLRHAKDPRGLPVFRDVRQTVTFPAADALSWLLAARALALDVFALKSGADSQLKTGQDGLVESFYIDLATVFSAQAAGSVAQVCTGLLFGCDPHFSHGTETSNNFTISRTKLYESLAGALLARKRAIQFIRNLDIEAICPGEFGAA